jgi:hypothetical protein
VPAPIINLSYHYPIVISLLHVAFTKENIDLWRTHQKELAYLLEESIRNHRSDAIAWILYFCMIFSHPISNETAENIIETKDCIPILLLYKSGKNTQVVIDFCNNLITNYKNSPYDLDRYWLLLYQLFLDAKIQNPYDSNYDKGAYETFEILKRNEVSFQKRIILQ